MFRQSSVQLVSVSEQKKKVERDRNIDQIDTLLSGKSLGSGSLTGSLCERSRPTRGAYVGPETR